MQLLLLGSMLVPKPSRAEAAQRMINCRDLRGRVLSTWAVAWKSLGTANQGGPLDLIISY